MSMLGLRQGQTNPGIPGFPGFGVPKLALVDGHGPWAWARGPWAGPGMPHVTSFLLTILSCTV